jgi:hypothetical protein
MWTGYLLVVLGGFLYFTQFVHVGFLTEQDRQPILVDHALKEGDVHLSSGFVDVIGSRVGKFDQDVLGDEIVQTQEYRLDAREEKIDHHT